MAFEELKARHSVVWGAGPYQRVTDNLIDAHNHLLETTQPVTGERWLDVATGTGAVALRAAAQGADVTAQDIAPELIAAASRFAEATGLDIDLLTGDCEELPFEDGEFDTVSSTFGHMFSPDHEAAARELARVTREGGRVALLTWSPEAGVVDLFEILAGYQQRPSGIGNPFAWGDTDHVESLLGEQFDLAFARGYSTHSEPSAHSLWRVFVEDYGPITALAASLTPAELNELERECVAYFSEFSRADGSVAWRREYLLTTGVRTDVPARATELNAAAATA